MKLYSFTVSNEPLSPMNLLKWVPSLIKPPSSKESLPNKPLSDKPLSNKPLSNKAPSNVPLVWKPWKLKILLWAYLMDIVCFSKDIWAVFTLFEILGKAREKLKWADGKAVKAEIDMQVCGTMACYKSVLLSACHSVCPSVVTPSISFARNIELTPGQRKPSLLTGISCP